MSTNLPEWSRLIAAARRARSEARDETAPYGFSTRVVAQAMAARPAFAEGAVFARFGLRALGVSCLLALVCVAATYRPILAAIEEEAASLSETAADVETTELT